MPAHPPLTLDQLREIQSRRRSDPDITALLWEVHRLRATAISADQFLRAIGEGAIYGTYAGLSAKDLRSRLSLEPAVIEDAARRLKR